MLNAKREDMRIYPPLVYSTSTGWVGMERSDRQLYSQDISAKNDHTVLGIYKGCLKTNVAIHVIPWGMTGA